MRILGAVYVAVGGVALAIASSFPASASAQVPSAQVPKERVAAPAGAAVIETPAPATAAAPAAPAPEAPAEPAPVSAAPAPTGVIKLTPTPAPSTSSSSSAAIMAKGYSAARFSLNLDGINAGFLQAVEGGAAVGTVAVENLGPDNISKKHVTGVKYQDLSFDVPMDSKPVIDWVTATWQGKSSKKNGSVQILDYDNNVVLEREFKNAVITGTTVPALEPSGGKKAVSLTVTIAPESVHEVKGSGKAPASSAKKGWLSSNLRFEMGDLETPVVRRIESFTVGQKVTEKEVGETREFEKVPNTLEFPNLKVTMANLPGPSWVKWQEQFLINGNGGEAQEKNGALVFLDQTLKSELGRINLFNCGLVRLGGDRLETGSDKGISVTAELYCERMELAVNK